MSTVIDAIMRLKDQFTPVIHQVNKSAAEHTKVQKRLEKSLGKTKKQFASLGTGAIIGGTALVGAVGAAVKANLELEGAIGKLNASGKMSGESMAGMREQINKTAESSHMARSEIASLFLAAKQGGLQAAQVEGTVAAAVNYAKVAGIDKAESVKSLTQITRAWTLTEKDQIAAMDQAAKIASKTGQNLGELQTTIAGMSEHAARAGVSFSDLTTTLGYMRGNLHMTSAQSQSAMQALFNTLEGGAPKASKALATIGMTSQQLAEDVKQNGLGSAMAQVAKKVADSGGNVEETLKKITGSTEGAKLALQLMSTNGMSNFKDLAAACKDSSGTVKAGLSELAKNPAVQFANAKQDILTQFHEIVGDFLPLFTAGMHAITGLIHVIMGLPAPIRGGIEAFAGIIIVLTGLAVLLGTVGSAVLSGGLVFLKILPYIKKATVAIRAFSIAASANPLGMLIIGITLLVAGFIYAYKHCETFRNGVDKLIGNIKERAAPAIAKVSTAIAAFGQKVQAIVTKVQAFITQKLNQGAAFFTKHKATIDAILNAMAAVFNTVCNLIGIYFSTEFNIIGDILSMFINVAGDVIGFIADVFTGNWQGAWEHIKQIFADIWDGIKNIFSDVINGISSALDRIIGKAGDAKSAAADAESGEAGHNASGTNNWRGGLTWIHERGGELVDLPRGTRIYPHDKSLQMEYQRGQQEAGAGISINIPKLADSIIVHDRQDIDDIANALVFKLKGYSINAMKGAI